jgi:hypothetical protein
MNWQILKRLILIKDLPVLSELLFKQNILYSLVISGFGFDFNIITFQAFSYLKKVGENLELY